MIERLIGPTSFPPAGSSPDSISLLSYNVLLPNSKDGWWTYKMYLPPLSNAITEQGRHISSWEYRSNLIAQRLGNVDSDVVCLQEVCPESFETDFAFMKDDLGYDGCEMFKRGRFRPATFWKTDRVELVAPPIHKDRTLLTIFRTTNKQTLLAEGESHDSNTSAATKKQTPAGGESHYSNTSADSLWFVLNCHLQSGPNGPRRVRQIDEGMKSIITAARKLKITSPESAAAILVCGDFNGGAECGAIRYLEDGVVDKNFREDGQPVVTSSPKKMPLSRPLVDVSSMLREQREPPPTLVVTELISQLVGSSSSSDSEPSTSAYESPKLSIDMIQRLHRVYDRLATTRCTNVKDGIETKVMGTEDVERYLMVINGQLGRGSEFREAIRQMTAASTSGESTTNADNDAEAKVLPRDGILTIEGFVQIYQMELNQGKFWGIAFDCAVLGEPLSLGGLCQARFDRIYGSANIQADAVMDFLATEACPNAKEPSDHLPIAGRFQKVGSNV